PTKFVDAWLQAPGYTSRMTQVYMDLLRLAIGPQFQFVPAQATLRRVQVLGPDGLTMVTIYYRQNQRRPRIETDGEFCLSQAETGLQFPRNPAPTGTATAVAQTTLDTYTTLVSPWWLYADYRADAPSQAWDGGFPADAGALGFTPADALPL